MADAVENDDATPPAKEEEETNHSNQANISTSLLAEACTLSSPSSSTSNMSTDNPLKATDSGIVLENSAKGGISLENILENAAKCGELTETELENSARNDASVENELVGKDSGVTLENSAVGGASAECEPFDCEALEKSAVVDTQASSNNELLVTEEPSDNTNNVEMEDTQDSDSSLPRRRRRNIFDSSSENEDTSGPDLTRTDDDEGDSDMEASGAQAVSDIPKDTWNPLKEITSRERGLPSHHYSSFLLRERTGASINLVRRLKLHTKLEHHEGCVNSLHFNSTGSLLASGSDDLNIVVWDWARGKPYFVFDSGHRSNVFQSKFVPHCAGDSLMVSCARDGCVRLAELSSAGTCRGTKKLAQHRGAAHKLALIDDSPHMCYSCGEDAVVFQIDLRENKPHKLCVTKENDRKVPLYSIHTHPARTHEFCVGGRDPYVRIYDTRMLSQDEESMSCVKKFCPHHLMGDAGNTGKANVTCAVYNWNGTEVIGTYNDEDIYMFNTAHSDGANYIHKYCGHRNNATVKGVNFYGPKSEFIVSGSDCGNVFLWEKQSEKIVTYFNADEGGVVNVLEPHPHNPYLATSGLDHDVKIFLPISENPTNLGGLKRVMKRNHREREDERSSEPDMIDGHMMWVLLQHLRRSARSRAREGGEELTPSSSDDDDDDDHDEFDDSDADAGPPQCASS